MWTTDKKGWKHFRMWVISGQMWTINKSVNMHLGSELLTSILSDENFWQEWVNMHPEGELLFSVWTDKNHWQEWVNTCPASELISSVGALANWSHWWEWPNISVESELLSGVWVNQNHWQVWLNICLESELLIFFWIISDVNGSTFMQIVSWSLVFEQIRTTYENG